MLNELAEHIVSLQEASGFLPDAEALPRADRPQSQPSVIGGFQRLPTAAPAVETRNLQHLCLPNASAASCPFLQGEGMMVWGEKPRETHHNPRPQRKRGPLSFGL